MTKNKHKVQKEQWERWSPRGHYVFNSVYEQVLDQTVFSHPKTRPVTAKQWKTTAWNAAWVAADAASEEEVDA
jgi:hypothetical protein